MDNPTYCSLMINKLALTLFSILLVSSLALAEIPYTSAAEIPYTSLMEKALLSGTIDGETIIEPYRSNLGILWCIKWS